MIGRVALIGMGMIGGSLASALRQHKLCEEITAYDVNRKALIKAVGLKLIDNAAASPCEAVRQADVVVLAVPVGATEEICRSIQDCLPEQAVLTDVGSVKEDVVKAVERGLGFLPSGFVPGHPIAGKELSGIEAASADLFFGRRVVLTPTSETSPESLALIRQMWEGVGAVVEEMAIEYHDEVLAATSHLPHLLAFALVESLAKMGGGEDIFRYAAGGFRDFTRIASSDPTMWRDICLSNRNAILEVLNRFEDDLHELSQAIAKGDAELLLDTFRHAKRTRDHFFH